MVHLHDIGVLATRWPYYCSERPNRLLQPPTGQTYLVWNSWSPNSIYFHFDTKGHSSKNIFCIYVLLYHLYEHVHCLCKRFITPNWTLISVYPYMYNKIFVWSFSISREYFDCDGVLLTIIVPIYCDDRLISFTDVFCLLNRLSHWGPIYVNIYHILLNSSWHFYLQKIISQILNRES